MGDKKLSHEALAIFEAAKRGKTQLIISAVVIAELYYANKKHHLFADFGTTFRDLKARTYIQFVSFSVDDAAEFDIDSAVPEMHDRIITGLARRISAPLITHDPLIAASGLVRILW